MWLETEIDRLSSLYAKLENSDISQVLPTEELEVISDLSSYEMENIANKLFVHRFDYRYLGSYSYLA